MITTIQDFVEAAKVFEIALQEATINGVFDDMQIEMEDPDSINQMCEIVGEIISLERYIQVEYDPTYCGGDYSGVGHFAYIPVSLVDKMGVAKAFEQQTKVKPFHIIHFSNDELYVQSRDGEKYFHAN